MTSPKRLHGSLTRRRWSSIVCRDCSSKYSTYLQPAAQSVSPISQIPRSPSTPSALSSPLGKSSHVQQMWFHGQLGSTRLSKEELSQNIAAMLDEEHGSSQKNKNASHEVGPNITLLVGELIHSVPSPENAEIQINSVKLSNVCSPRTVLSGRMRQTTSELQGRKVVVAVPSNVSLNHAKGSFSEGVILCDRQGELLDPGHHSRVGGQVKLVGNGQILKHLQFSEAGFANLCHGQLASEDGQILRNA